MRRYDRALETASLLPDLSTSQFQLICRPLCEALVERAMEQPDRARTSFEAARTLIEAHVQSGAEDANAASALALVEAGLGNKAAAERAGKRALDLFPANKDKWIRTHRLFDLYVVYTMLENQVAAIDRLEELLASPNQVISTPVLRTSPFCDPLRDNPRFERLEKRTS
jgi:tetratricopeptide (TPR) repeat protein